MGEKSPVQLYWKLFLIDTAVIVCVVVLLASYFISVVGRNARDNNLSYTQMVCDRAKDYLKKSSDTADSVLNGLYRSRQELDDLMHYMKDDIGDYLVFRLDAYAKSGGLVYNGIDDFAEEAMDSFPDIVSLRFVSYKTGETTAYLPEGKSYRSAQGAGAPEGMSGSAGEEMPESAGEGMPGSPGEEVPERAAEGGAGGSGSAELDGRLSFSREIRDPQTLDPVGCMMVDFDTGEFSEAHAFFERADLFVLDPQGQVVYGSAPEKAEKVAAVFRESSESGGLKRRLDFYVCDGEAGGFRSIALLKRAGASHFSVALFLAILGFSAVLIAAGEFLLFEHLKGLTARLNRILTGMEQVTRGNLAVRLETGERKDELDVISGHFNQMCQDLDMYIEKSYRAELEQKNAEMAALQSQINPHFLYNTLEAIRMKAICNKDREVGKMLYSLAVLFRSQIKEDDVIALAKELHYCKKYLELFEFRYQGKLHTCVECPEEFMRAPVIKFIVQPVIENYFEHGIRMEASDNRLKIHVEGAAQGEDIRICVEDNGRGMSGEQIRDKNRELSENAADNRGSIGLTNVNRRMKAAYGMDYGVTLMENEGGGLLVVLKFPWRGEAEHEEGHVGGG